MKKIDYLKITSQFDDVKPILDNYLYLRKQEVKVRRRIKTIERKYSFLATMVGINTTGDLLLKSIISAFKDLGFGTQDVDDRGNEDIRLWIDDRLIIAEVTGNKKAVPKHNKAHAISKHIPLTQAKYPDLKVTGLFIVNHDNSKYYNERAKAFGKEIIAIAKSNKYNVLTTVDLLNLFIEVKTGKKTINQFVKELTTFT